MEKILNLFESLQNQPEETVPETAEEAAVTEEKLEPQIMDEPEPETQEEPEVAKEEEPQTEEVTGTEPVEKAPEPEPQETEQPQPEPEKKPEPEQEPDWASFDQKEEAAAKKMEWWKHHIEKEADHAIGDFGIIFDHIAMRCKEDLCLAEDVIQSHKTYKRFMNYIYHKAFDVAIKVENCGSVAGVTDETVKEWAEDYFRMDDLEEIQRQEKEAAEKKAEMLAKTKTKKKPVKKETPAKAKNAAKKKKEEKEEFKQVDIFSLFS